MKKETSGFQMPIEAMNRWAASQACAFERKKTARKLLNLINNTLFNLVSSFCLSQVQMEVVEMACRYAIFCRPVFSPLHERLGTLQVSNGTTRI